MEHNKMILKFIWKSLQKRRLGKNALKRWTQGRRTQGEMNWESRIDTYTLLCVK